MIKYVEIAYASFKQRGHAINLADLPKWQYKAQQEGKELYRSYYYFDFTLLEHLQAFKTIRGYNATPIIEQIIFDIDKGADSDEQVHQRATAFYQHLDDIHIADENIRPYYSGSGYHFVVPNLWNFRTASEVFETLATLFPESDSIYERSQLIRVPNTINNKTGRYKIPLETKELLHTSTQNILQLSCQPRSLVYPEFNYTGHELESQKIIPRPQGISSQPGMVKEEGITPSIICMQKLYNLPPRKGSRHKSIIRMVSAFKRAGIPRGGIELMMQSWVQGTMESGEIRKIVEDVFGKNYQFSCHDEIMMEYCDERCIFFKRKSYNMAIPKDTENLENEFRRFATDESQIRINLQDHTGSSFPFYIYPEELVVVWGDTGTGKSSLIQNWCVVEKKYKILYLNFEVGERLMYRRELQIAHGMTKDDVLQHYLNPRAKSLAEPVSHIHMISSYITLPVLEQLIVAGGYNLIIADTLGGFSVPGVSSDITAKTEVIAPALKQLAIKYKIIILAIHHIAKSKAEDEEGNIKKLTVHSGIGSSAIEHEADKIILLEGSKTCVRRIQSAKARDERPFTVSMMFDAERTFRFYKESQWKIPRVENSEESSSISSEILSLQFPGQKKE